MIFHKLCLMVKTSEYKAHKTKGVANYCRIDFFPSRCSCTDCGVYFKSLKQWDHKQ